MTFRVADPNERALFFGILGWMRVREHLLPAGLDTLPKPWRLFRTPHYARSTPEPLASSFFMVNLQ